MQRSEHSNAQAGEVLTPEDIHDGLAISCYLSPDSDVPSMDFFYSEHCLGVYKEPSFLPFTTSFGTGEVFGCAVDVPVVHRFLEGLTPLGGRINKEGRCRSGEPDFHGSYLALNEDGEQLLKALHSKLDDFIQSGEWIDQSIEVVDYLDHWTPEVISGILTKGMREAEAHKILREAHESAQSWNYRIIGSVEEVLDHCEEFWA